MPIYDFMCEKCDLEYEVVQSIKEYDGNWTCTQCKGKCVRIYTYCTFHHTGAKIEDAEFNPGLGCITKSKAHREEIAKRKGAVAIGNDFHAPDSVHKHFDSDRETKIKKSWDDV